MLEIGGWGISRRILSIMGGLPVGLDLSIFHIYHRFSGGTKDRRGGYPTYGEAKEEQYHMFMTWECGEDDTNILDAITYFMINTLLITREGSPRSG